MRVDHYLPLTLQSCFRTLSHSIFRSTPAIARTLFQSEASRLQNLRKYLSKNRRNASSLPAASALRFSYAPLPASNCCASSISEVELPGGNAPQSVYQIFCIRQTRSSTQRQQR